MSTQGKYRIRNWKEYNKSLIQRGSITVWLSEDAVEKWFAQGQRAKKDILVFILMMPFLHHC